MTRALLVLAAAIFVALLGAATAAATILGDPYEWENDE